MHRLFAAAALLLFATPVFAAMQASPVEWTIGKQGFAGYVVYDDASREARPGIVMVPNWMGPTLQSAEKAKRAAGDRYVVFMADLYGVDIRPQNADEASKAAGALRSDRALMRKRTQKALDVLKAQQSVVNMDASKIGAIGFCFGGGAVLELTRAGAQVAGVVSFHGNLDTPNTADAKNIKSRVLVLHGADDPSVPKQQVGAFVKEMQDANADWQLVMFGNAVHSFTNPQANTPGRNQYNPEVAARAFAMMNNFFDEIFEIKP